MNPDSIKTGGPAFPHDLGYLDEPNTAGLSIRDYFAAKAMQGLCANPGGPFQANGMNGWGIVNCTSQDVANYAYDIADAMLAAREAK